MHRIDTDTAQVDKFGAGKNGFTGGNPQTGELPTALDEDFFDALQEEISRVVEAAGITLSKGHYGQLLQALGMLYAPLSSLGNKQDKNDNLTAFAGLDGAADRLGYFTAAKTLALATLTSVGRDIVGKSTVADVLTYLGLGSAATKSVGTGTGQIPDMNSFRATLGASAGVKILAGNPEFIIQWGTFSLPAAASSAVTITFPVAFPTASFFVCPVPGSGSAQQMIGVYDLSSLTASLVKGNQDTAARSGRYIAFGY